VTAKTVLLVEDDDAFRYAAARHLAQAGLRVVEAKDTLEALRLLQSGETADCLVTDIQMPPSVPHGLSLANMLRARTPDQSVVFVTAYQHMASATRELWGTDSVLSKPVDLNQLAQEIKRRIEPEPARSR
jgi:CheY-like chemotaxis protein